MSNCPICHKNDYIKAGKLDKPEGSVHFAEPSFMEWTLINGLTLNFEVCSNCSIQFCINLEDYHKAVNKKGKI
jgi:hypothetical protein